MRLHYVGMLAATFVSLYGAVCTAASSAPPACVAAERHVSLEFDGTWPESFAERVLTDLSASLSSQRMSACSAEDATEQAVSRVRIFRLSHSKIRIEVADTLTDKNVTRDIQLDRAIDDSSALIIAVAVDELLHATWAELTLKRRREVAATATLNQQPATSPAPPLSTQEATPAAKGPPPLPLHRLALRFAVDHFTAGSTFFGPDLLYGSQLGDVVEWSLHGGARFARHPHASDYGELKAQSITWGLSIGVPVLRSARVAFGPVFGLQGAQTWFQGQSDDEGLEDSLSGTSLSLRGGAALRWLVGDSFLELQTRLGVPVVRVIATDGTRDIGGTKGLEWTSNLAWGWWWQK